VVGWKGRAKRYRYMRLARLECLELLQGFPHSINIISANIGVLEEYQGVIKSADVAYAINLISCSLQSKANTVPMSGYG
jgi:molybdopterin/thiamine biosynthesis adenylyltransferase